MCLIENLACMLLNMGYSESYPTSAERSPFKEKLEEADKGAKEAKKGVIFFLRVIDKVNRQKSSIVIPPNGIPPDTQIPVAKYTFSRFIFLGFYINFPRSIFSGVRLKNI